MAAEGFYLWRRIADIKNDLRKSCDNPNGLDFELLDSINSAINQIESLNGTIRPFIERCGEVFSSLSIQSRVSCGKFYYHAIQSY